MHFATAQCKLIWFTPSVTRWGNTNTKYFTTLLECQDELVSGILYSVSSIKAEEVRGFFFLVHKVVAERDNTEELSGLGF